MSDDEHSEGEAEIKKPQAAAPAPKKRTEISTKGMDDAAKELLENNRQDRVKMEEEINELKKRNEKRKKEREEYEKRLAVQKKEDEERKKIADEEKRKKKEEEEQKVQKARASKLAEYDKMKNLTKPNFVITGRTGGGGGGEDEEETKPRKSKEQLDAEKKAIMKQRITPLGIEGFDESKLKSKAEELNKMIFKLEGDKYDLERRFQMQQVDMNELHERARSANKVGKGGLKRVHETEALDVLAARFTGTPSKVEMYSKYERQKDKRSYVDRKTYWSGPSYKLPPERIIPTKSVQWEKDSGLPVYAELGAGGGGHGEHDD